MHSFLTWDDVTDLSSQQICERLIEIGETMSHALEIVVAHHVATDSSMILEGDGLVPAVAAQKAFDGFPVETQVRSVFIVDAAKEHLIENMNRRKRGDFSKLPIAEQHRRTQAYWLYGQWLKTQAEQYKLPVVGSRPWETLAQRVIQAISHEC